MNFFAPFVSQQEFSREDLASYYQARVAQAFTEPVLRQLVADADPDISHDVVTIAHQFLKPVQDIGLLDEASRYDAATLQKLYDLQEQSRTERHTAFDDILRKYEQDPATLRRLMDHVVRISHITKAAAPHAHENVMDVVRTERDQRLREWNPDAGRDPKELGHDLPKGLEQFILDIIREGGIENGDQLYDLLARSHVVSVSTAHPTRYVTPDFTNTRLAFLLSARELTRAASENSTLLTDYVEGRGPTFEAVKKWYQSPITFTDANGGPANMTPRQEIEAGVNDFTDDFCRNVDDVFRIFDDTLRRLSEANLIPWKYTEAEQEKLRISMIFSTWIAGDKDGNNNMRSEHLLLAALLFRKQGAKLIAQQMNDAGLILGNAPGGSKWANYFAQKEQEMAAISEPLLRTVIEKGKSIDLPLSHQEFTDTLATVRKVYGDIEATTDLFKSELSKALPMLEGQQRETALSLLRKTRIFGLGMMRFHLRETADEYTPIIDTLLRGDQILFGYPINYTRLEPEQKLAVLNRAIAREASTPGSLSALKDRFFAKLSERGRDVSTMRVYSADDPEVITAHTLQRFEVGTLHKGLITDHILAECTGAQQMLEVLLISKITGVPMTVAPLLEEHETLTQALPIFREAFKQRAWRDHMWEMAGGDPTEIVNQLKIQYAHSDNMRRMGLPAARANIYEQANLLESGFRKLFPHILELYIRDGRIGREDIWGILAKMHEKPNAYCPRQFHGGSRCDTARGGIRSTIAFTDDVKSYQWTEGTDQGGDNPELRLAGRLKRLMTTLVARSTHEMVKQLNDGGRVWNKERESKIREAIDRSIDDYMTNHYGPDNQLGQAMGEAGLYKLNAAYNNPGSRAARNVSGGVKPVELGIDPVDPADMRTIGFTSTGLDMGVGFGVLPMRNMQQYINEMYAANDDLREDLQRNAIELFGAEARAFDKNGLTSIGLQTLNKVSPTYRAAVADFPGYAVAISDPQLTLDLLQQRKERGGPAASQHSLDYFDKSLPKDIVGAAAPFLKARGYEIPEGFISQNELENPTAETCRKLSFLVRKLGMPHIDEQLGIGERVHHFGRMVRERILNTVWQTRAEGTRKLTNDEAYIFRLTGVLRSVFGHVLYDGVADNALGKERIAKRPDNDNYWQPARRATGLEAV